jgi:putative tricarboxylic transport membrane protein
VGPNFLAWLVSMALMVCGAWPLRQARTCGFRELDPPSGSARGDWRAFAWISAGVLANATLITRIRFILSCTLCFMLAVRGLPLAEGRPAGSVR